MHKDIRADVRDTKRSDDIPCIGHFMYVQYEEARVLTRSIGKDKNHTAPTLVTIVTPPGLSIVPFFSSEYKGYLFSVPKASGRNEVFSLRLINLCEPNKC